MKQTVREFLTYLADNNIFFHCSYYVEIFDRSTHKFISICKELHNYHSNGWVGELVIDKEKIEHCFTNDVLDNYLVLGIEIDDELYIIVEPKPKNQNV
jgi:hypothetical protein